MIRQPMIRRCSIAPLAIGATLLVLAGCGGKDDVPPRDERGEAPAAAAPAPAAAAPAAAFDPAGSDPQAIAVADRVLLNLGGEAAWAGTRSLVFTFAVARGDTEFMRRTHYWDRATGRHRVEFADREQRAFVVIHTIGDTTVSAVLAAAAGAPVTDPAELRALREHAHAMWVNDGYWLLMPYKLKDPGVHLAYEGEKSEGGTTWEVIRLSFDRVGLTPGDQYWAYMNRATGLVERWAFRLESMPPDAEPKAFDWMNWRRYGGILLADARVAVGGNQRIFFPDLAVAGELPAGTFTSTAPVALPAL
jgi:hypothetical protein